MFMPGLGFGGVERYTDHDKSLGAVKGCLAKSFGSLSDHSSTVSYFPQLYTTHFALKMLTKVSRHSLHDCLKSIRQGDTRCRTCAKIYQRGRNDGLPGYCPTHGGDRTKEMTALRRNDSLPGHCPTHTKEQDKEMAVLGKIAVEMQDWFHQKSVKRYEERHGRLQRLGGLTDGEAWMWTRTRAAWLQCGHSLRDIGPHWWGHWFASEDDRK
jgi:hypothetical protein